MIRLSWLFFKEPFVISKIYTSFFLHFSPDNKVRMLLLEGTIKDSVRKPITRP